MGLAIVREETALLALECRQKIDAVYAKVAKPRRRFFEKIAPHRIENSLAFMWESRYVFRPTKFALGAPQLQKNYDAVWDGFRKTFK